MNQEYITPEERAKGIEEIAGKNYKETMKLYALSIIVKIKRDLNKDINKILSILKYFEEHYKSFDAINIVKITLAKIIEGEQEAEKNKTNDKISIVAPNGTKNLYDYMLGEKTINVTDEHTINNFPLEVLGELFQKITIANFLQEYLEEKAKRPKQKKANNNKITELQPSQIKKINEIYISNTKLSNKINKIPLSSETNEATIYIDKEKKIPTTLKITNINYTNEGIKIKGYNKINYFDKFVHDTVCTFWEQGQKNITPTMILRAMRGNPKQKDFSPQQIKAVAQSLDKMRFIGVEIDATKEARLKKWIDKDSQMIFKSYLLPLTGIAILTGGNELEGFNIIDCPPLWAYTKQTKQRITIKDDLIKNLSFDKHGIIYYLIQRLHLIKHKQNKGINDHSNVIVIKNMFEELDLKQEFKDKKKKARILNNIIKNLDVWKKQNEIKKYEIITENKVKSKIKIIM